MTTTSSVARRSAPLSPADQPGPRLATKIDAYWRAVFARAEAACGTGLEQPEARHLLLRGAPVLHLPGPALAAALGGLSPEHVSRTQARLLVGHGGDAVAGALAVAAAGSARVEAPGAASLLTAAADIIEEGLARCDGAGTRVLFAAWRGVPIPDDPALSLWLGATCVREYELASEASVAMAYGLTPVQARHLLSLAGFGPAPTALSSLDQPADDRDMAALVASTYLEPAGLPTARGRNVASWIDRDIRRLAHWQPQQRAKRTELKHLLRLLDPRGS